MPRNWLEPPRLRVQGTDEERHATWLELFFDLVFVVAISQLATTLYHDVSFNGFVRFVALFIPVWWAWIGAAYYATRFDTDDTLHRVLTAVQIFAVAALAVNTPHGLERTSVGFAISYASVRLILVIEYIRAGRSVPEARPLTRRYSSGFSAAAIIWLASTLVPPPIRFLMWGIALMIDFGTPIFAGRLHAQLPPHTSHLPERFGLLTIIVLGESVAGVVRGIDQSRWNLFSSLTAALGLALAFSLWWVYFAGASGSAIRTAVRRGKVGVYQFWIYTHLVLAIGLTATGVGIHRAAAVAPRSALPSADRWELSVAVFLCLLALGVIHLTLSLEDMDISIREERGTIYRFAAAAAALLTAALGTNLLPITLTAILSLICASQVVLDFYESSDHEQQAPSPLEGEGGVRGTSKTSCDYRNLP